MKQPLDSLTKRLTPRDQFTIEIRLVSLLTLGPGLFAYWFIIALGDAVMDGRCYPNAATRMIGTASGLASLQP